MNYKVKKAAVLGSGVMGSGIACHLANVGIDAAGRTTSQQFFSLLFAQPATSGKSAGHRSANFA